MMKDKLRDLGLSYEEAGHGVQSAKALDQTVGGDRARKFEEKHMRVGIDLSKADQYGLACLLIDKGVFTAEEYAEYVRLSVNEELAREQDIAGTTLR